VSISTRTSSGLAPAKVALINQLDRGPASRVIIVGVRIAVALLWIQNVNWKNPPDFGRSSNSGLFEYTDDAILHPVFPPFSWLVQHVILPNFVPFGYLTLGVEFFVGAFLLAGFLTRFWAIIGLLQTVGITLSALNGPHEWHWSYYLMFVAQFVVLAAAAGRVAGVDGLFRPRWAASSTRLSRLFLRLS
jgi:uncharacterized membrane protein YphA (DoxX/SURF4 family)